MDRKKILIVDDDDTIRTVLEKALTKAGYCVRLASGAEEALALLRKEHIPVIFLDLGLDGINGFELCGQIRKISPPALIYALSGYAELYSPQDIVQAGFDAYFTKPFSINTLFEVARDSFEKLQLLTGNQPP